MLLPKRISDQSFAESARSLAINLTSTVRICEHLLTGNPRARIAVLGSESFRGSFDTTYFLAKAGVNAYVQQRRLPHPGQQLVVVSPTIILDSGMTRRRQDPDRVAERAARAPKHRFLRAAEVSRLLHYVLYVDEGMLTNTVVSLNGGSSPDDRRVLDAGGRRHHRPGAARVGRSDARGPRRAGGPGIPACVGDGGSSDEFVAAVRAMGHDVGSRGAASAGRSRPRWRARATGEPRALRRERQAGVRAVRAAADHRRVRRAGSRVRLGGSRPCGPGRASRAPQVEIERAENALIGGVLGIEGDFVAGPALMPASHVARLTESAFYGTDQHGWGAWFLLGRAWATGLRVGVIDTAPGVHPDARDEFNPGYRLYQAYSDPRRVLRRRRHRIRLARSGRRARVAAGPAGQTGWPTWARA